MAKPIQSPNVAFNSQTLEYTKVDGVVSGAPEKIIGEYISPEGRPWSPQARPII